MRTITAAAVIVTVATGAFAQSLAPPGATACLGCHGPSRAGTSLPPLQGQSPDDIIGAMQAFRSGQRAATVMDRIAKGFSDEETRAIAVWLGQKQ